GRGRGHLSDAHRLVLLPRSHGGHVRGPRRLRPGRGSPASLSRQDRGGARGGHGGDRSGLERQRGLADRRRRRAVPGLPRGICGRVQRALLRSDHRAVAARGTRSGAGVTAPDRQPALARRLRRRLLALVSDAGAGVRGGSGQRGARRAARPRWLLPPAALPDPQLVRAADRGLRPHRAGGARRQLPGPPRHRRAGRARAAARAPGGRAERRAVRRADRAHVRRARRDAHEPERPPVAADLPGARRRLAGRDVRLPARGRVAARLLRLGAVHHRPPHDDGLGAVSEHPARARQQAIRADGGQRGERPPWAGHRGGLVAARDGARGRLFRVRLPYVLPDRDEAQRRRPLAANFAAPTPACFRRLVVKNTWGADDHLRMALRDRARTPRSEALVDLFARRERPHAGADLPTARKFVGLLGGISAALTVAFLAMAPPTSQSDVAGWPTAILIVALAAAGSRWLVVSRERVGFNQLLMFCYLGLAETAALQWLAGGASPYRALFLLWLGAGVATNTPRRGLAYIVAVVVFGSLPLAYADAQHISVDIATDALVWVAMGAVMLLLIDRVRTQRAQMQSIEEDAKARAEEAVKRVQGLEAVADAALAHLPFDDLLSELLNRVSRVLEVERAAILLRDEDRDCLTVRAARGGGAGSAFSRRVSIGEGIAGQVAQSKRPVFVDDLEAGGVSSVVWEDSVRSVLAVPLL